MARVLKNHDVESLYPSLVEEYGYSSRNQANKNEYVDILHTRKKAKHGLLTEDFLEQFDVTNKELNKGLKLPLNAYTGCLRALFNKLYDPLQGFSICTTGQCLMMQLIYDLMEIPTLEMISANTDAVMYTIDETLYPRAVDVLQKWQKKTRLKLEDDDIQKIVMRDVNNYCEIVRIGDNDYEVHYKGGELTRGEHEFKWNKDKKVFEYTYKKSLKSNSMSIVSEALLKRLLFDIPVEKTINECNDIFRFQIISHLGSTYEKCVQESPNGDIELQRNNRIYAGLIPSGNIVKIKPNGRRDSLANCPTNPIVDNANKLTIDKVNKEWYIEYANEKVNDFLGIKRLEDYKKDELLALAIGKGLLVDKKVKKIDLINMIKSKERGKNMTKKEEKLEEVEVEEVKQEKTVNDNERLSNYAKLLQKINKFRSLVQNRKFVLDKAMTNNLGGEEYHSIGQYYNTVQELCIECGLDFSFNVVDEIRFERNIITPATGSPRHLSTVKCEISLSDIDTGETKYYTMIASGNDSIDKGVSGASTLAFRNWFKFNFSPKCEFDWDDPSDATENEISNEPKVPTYLPENAKKEIMQKITSEEQHEDSDKELIDYLIKSIYAIREYTKDDTYGKNVLAKLTTGNPTSVELLSYKVTIQDRLATYKIEVK